MSAPLSRGALTNSTNHSDVPTIRFLADDEKVLTKRPRSHDFAPERKKRIRYTTSEPADLWHDVRREEGAGGSSEDSDSDEEVSPVSAPPPMSFARAQHARASARPRTSSRYLLQPSRPLLSSLVSSEATDRFVCHSAKEDAFLTPPYACAYSYRAKRGGVPHLAVATEQGSIYIWDTSRRSRTDLAAQRIDLDIHGNGIFDIQWSPTDDRLATASADHTTRITDPTTGRVLAELHGHTYTAKTVAWDPSHADLLATGSRDGSICLWDLRAHDRMLVDDTTVEALRPVATIRSAHEELSSKGGKKSKKFVARTVTSVVYSPLGPYGLVSSGSANGILRHWDLRFPNSKGKTKAARDNSIPLHASPFDPTTTGGARARGITSLCAGSGPSGSAVFALGCDSRVHAYALPSLHPFPSNSTTLAHPELATNSFYARIAMSPCGRWLASGSASGSAFVFDVAQTSRVRRLGAGAGMGAGRGAEGVKLTAQSGEITALSWAEGMLATCSDDGTVRVWRADFEGRWRCEDGMQIDGCDLVWAA